MAKYGEKAQKSVESAVRRQKSGTLESGKGGKAGKVKSRKQAIAIGLSEARKEGAKVPPRKSSTRGSSSKSSSSSTSSKKPSSRKSSSGKASSRKTSSKKSSPKRKSKSS